MDSRMDDRVGRRTFLQATGLGVLAVAGSQAGAEDSRPPNVLVIQTDEHHFNTLGCYGGTIVETPHIDWLATDGARCDRFYATTPVCSPSRAAFITGRYPHHTPVTTNNIPLADEMVTFAGVLQEQGYATGYAGKWHLDGDGKPQWAPERKFGFDDNRFMFNRGHWKKLEDTSDGPRVASQNKKGKVDYGVQGADEESFTTDWLANKTIDFIETNKEKPFCYMVSIPDPHGPNTVRAPYDTMYADVDVPIPSTLNKTEAETPKWAPREKGLDEARIRKLMPPYYGMVKCIDDNVGRILDTLRKNDLIDNTIIVFTSDHGDLCGEHGRCNKGVPYEGSARIPFVVYFPKKIPAGTVVKQNLSCVDFLPTVLSLADARETPEVHGRDASALLTGYTCAKGNDIVFLRGTQDWLCVVTPRYKLVYSNQGDPWLFDLKKDPDELKNGFHDPEKKETVVELTRALSKYCREYDEPYAQLPTIQKHMDAILAG